VRRAGGGSLLLPRTSDVTSVVLAGGRALRLPEKLRLPVAGEPMLARVIARVTAGGRACVISARTPPDGVWDWPVVYDAYPGGGPLGGIASAARRVRTPLFFAVAGDMPNMTSRFIDALEARYREAAAVGPAPHAIVPAWPDGKLEPLAALYDTQAFLDGSAAALRDGKRKVTSALAGLCVIGYPVTAADEWLLVNVNTAEDYARLDPTT